MPQLSRKCLKKILGFSLAWGTTKSVKEVACHCSTAPYSLSWNVGSHAFSAICKSDCIEENTTLTELDLGWNKISEKGAAAIAAMLEGKLTKLVLNDSLPELEMSPQPVKDLPKKEHIMRTITTTSAKHCDG